MIKIYCDPSVINRQNTDPGMFFDLNGTDVAFVNNVSECDITLSHDNDELRKKLIFQIFSNYENQLTDIIKWVQSPNVYVLTNAYSEEINDPKILFTDFLFNRTKAYYQQYAFRPDINKWYYESAECYMLPRIVDVGIKSRIFVAPNRVDIEQITNERSQTYRLRLIDFLKKYDRYGHTSIPPLYSHVEVDYRMDICQIKEIQSNNTRVWYGYSPPHNAYYEDSFIHISVETIEYGLTIAVTEKTYDPLIKGHFILPFSTHGFIKYLRNLGFMFPDFIDYSYDNICDDELRFNVYINEVERLVNTNINQWRIWWNNYQNIRLHNQKLFWQRDYHRIDLSKLLNL